jgi:hypothetical protein
MATIIDQPSPTTTERRPSWEVVAAYVDQIRNDSVASDTIALVLADMQARDNSGHQRYGTR